MKITQKSHLKNPWKTLKKRVVFKNPWIEVSDHDVIQPSGQKGHYGVVHFRNVAVGAVTLDERERVLLVGQYRYPLKAYSWEIPEGGCPSGESPLRAAKRELKEETGYQARRWSRILELHLSNSSTDERALIFLARDLKEGQASPEETEVLQTRWLDLKEAMRMIEKGQITDAISVAALLQVWRMKLEDRLK